MFQISEKWNSNTVRYVIYKISTKNVELTHVKTLSTTHQWELEFVVQRGTCLENNMIWISATGNNAINHRNFEDRQIHWYKSETILCITKCISTALKLQTCHTKINWFHTVILLWKSYVNLRHLTNPANQCQLAKRNLHRSNTEQTALQQENPDFHWSKWIVFCPEKRQERDFHAWYTHQHRGC